MSQDWERLANAIRAARAARGWTQSDLATAADVGFSTLQRLESGKRFSRMPTSVAPVERALGWTYGSAERVLAGGDPQTREDADVQAAGAVAATSRPALPVMVEHELAHGQLVDSPVIEIRPGLKAVVLVIRDEESEADGMSADIQAWTRVQRKLRGIVAEEQ